MILSWREVYHNYNSGTCDGAAYEKFDDGEDCLTQSGRAALVAAVEVPFDLPDGWAWTRIEDIALSIQYGYNASALLHGRIRMVRISDIQEGCIQWDKVPYCNIPESSIGKYLLEKGDILFARTGGTVGKSYLVSSLPKESVYAGYLVRTKCSSKVSTRFVKAFLESSFYWHQLRSGVIATAQPNFSGSKLASLLFPLPPLAEQKRIVAKIEELFAVADALGTAAEGLGNAARQLDRKILDLAIRGKLVPQDPDDEPASELLKRISASSHKSPYGNGKAKQNRRARGGDAPSAASAPLRNETLPPFAIPKSWEWVRLDTISNYGQCKSIEAQAIPADTWSLDLEDIEKDTGRLLARRTAVERKSSSSKHVFCKGMILYSKLRTYLNKVLVADMDGVCTSEIVPILTCDGLVPEYLRLVLMSSYFLQYTASRGYGVKMPRVGTGDMCSAFIPLPPLTEQKRIVEKVETLKSLMEPLATF